MPRAKPRSRGARETGPPSPPPTPRRNCGDGDGGSSGLLSKVKPSRKSLLRAAVLIGVHLLIAIHLAHWRLSSETISPVEPSEAMYTLERGIVNAGFIFFALAILSTLIFGRFFCGWACHIVALQDLCGSVMKRFGIRPRMFRTRTLVWVPFLVGFYMFLWPTVYRELIAPWLDTVSPTLYAWFGTPYPFDETHWELTKTRETFWETFPGWGVSLFTFFVCGFAVVYFLGAKGFCTYGCPYGAFFAVADRVAPGKIVANLDLCEKCGHCTAACTSNVAIHKEIQVYSKVVDTNCMKCLDCVSVCPNGALKFGFVTPKGARQPLPEKTAPKKRYDTTLPEELALWAIGFGSFWCFRAAYGLFPLLLSVGLAGITVFVAWRTYRLFRERNATLNHLTLKHGGKWKPWGVTFVAASGLFALTTLHTGWMKYEGQLASRAARGVHVTPERALALDYEPSEAVRTHATKALTHSARLLPVWYGGSGLLYNSAVDSEVAFQLAVLARYEEAIPFQERYLAAQPSDEGYAYLGQLYALTGDSDRAIETWRAHPSDRGHSYLGQLYQRLGQPDRAIAAWRERFEANPASPECVWQLVQAQVERQQIEVAAQTLDRALAATPNAARLHFLRAAIHMMRRDPESARASLKKAIELDPGNLDYRARWVELLLAEGKLPEAYPHLVELVRAIPNDPQIAQTLAGVCQQLGRTQEAQKWATEAQERAAAKTTSPQ